MVMNITHVILLIIQQQDLNNKSLLRIYIYDLQINLMYIYRPAILITACNNVLLHTFIIHLLALHCSRWIHMCFSHMICDGINRTQRGIVHIQTHHRLHRHAASEVQCIYRHPTDYTGTQPARYSAHIHTTDYTGTQPARYSHTIVHIQTHHGLHRQAAKLH